MSYFSRDSAFASNPHGERLAEGLFSNTTQRPERVDAKKLTSWSDELHDVIFELGESNLDPHEFEECLQRLEELEEAIVVASKQE